MKKKVEFARGLEANYFNNEGDWDSSTFLGIVYFAVDTQKIYLNGLTYGSSDKEILERLRIKDDTEIRLNTDSNVGGILSKARTVSNAFALIDDSLTWQTSEKYPLKDARVRFSLTDRQDENTDKDGTVEFCPLTHSISVNGEIYCSDEKSLSDAKKTFITRSETKEIIKSIGEILECSETQKEKLKRIIDSI